MAIRKSLIPTGTAPDGSLVFPEGDGLAAGLAGVIPPEPTARAADLPPEPEVPSTPAVDPRDAEIGELRLRLASVEEDRAKFKRELLAEMRREITPVLRQVDDLGRGLTSVADHVSEGDEARESDSAKLQKILDRLGGPVAVGERGRRVPHGTRGQVRLTWQPANMGLTAQVVTKNSQTGRQRVAEGYPLVVSWPGAKVLIKPGQTQVVDRAAVEHYLATNKAWQEYRKRGAIVVQDA